LAASRIGFNADIYFQDLTTSQILHYDPTRRFDDLRQHGDCLPPGRYIKKPVATTVVMVDTPIRYGNQEFAKGAVLQISSPGRNGRRSISWIDPSDVLDCYTWLSGQPLVDENGRINLPRYIVHNPRKVIAMTNTHVVTPEDVKGLETIQVQTQSSRVYVKPNGRFFEGADSATFLNEADQVTQKLVAQDGVVICAFNYRTSNDDYQTKADAFLTGINKAHEEANNFPDFIARVSELYRIHDVGTPDIYTSTREKMKLQGLEGVQQKVAVKTGQAELLRIVAPEDVIIFERASEHRGERQIYAGECIVQITDRDTKYEQLRGIQPVFAASAYETRDGKSLQIKDVPTSNIAQVIAPTPGARPQMRANQVKATQG